MSFGLGLGLGLIRSSDPDAALVASIVQNPNYTASVAGTNVATTRATGLLCPFTGASLSNDVPCTRRIYLGGKAHDAFGAWPQVTNLMPGYSFSIGLNSYTKSGISRNVIEDLSGTKHTAFNSVALSNSTTYMIQGIAKRGVGSRNAVIYVDTGANTAGIGLNLSDGTSQSIVRGNGIATKVSSNLLSDGSIRFSVLVSSPNWGGTVYQNLQLSATSPGSLDTYAGDGASSVIFTGVSITAVTVPFPLIGEATTVNADQHVFTIPTTTQTGAALVAGVPIYWSSPSGGPTPHSDGRYYEDGTDREGITIASNNQVAVYGGSVSKRTILSTLPQQSAGVPRTLTRTWSPTNQEMYKDGVFINNLPGSYTWETRSTVRIGNGKDYTRPFCGLVVIAFCNGFIPSTAAMAAWHRSVVRALQPLSVPIL